VSCSRDFGLWSAVDSFAVAAIVGVTSRAPVQVREQFSVRWVDLFDLSGRRVGRAAMDQRGQVTAVAGRLDRSVPMGLYLADGPACRKLVRAGGER
jgi:hypothetical protein